MTEDHFWQIVDRACQADRQLSDEWHDRLVAELSQLTAGEIVEWNHFFDRFVAQACTIDLMAACYVMNAGAGDDRFYFFRCWLVGMGRRTFDNALADADSLADVALPWSSGNDAEAEIYGAAQIAWMQVTGNPMTAPYPAHNEDADLVGGDWDFDDPDQMQDHLPRLTESYAEARSASDPDPLEFAQMLFAKANAAARVGAYHASAHTLTRCIQVVEHNSVDVNFSVYGLRGLAHYKIGDFESALHDTNTALDKIDLELESDDYYARLYYQRAMIYLQLGDRQAADRDFAEARRFDPERVFEPEIR